MRILRRILLAFLILIIGAGGFLAYQYYPLIKGFNGFKSAGTIGYGLYIYPDSNAEDYSDVLSYVGGNICLQGCYSGQRLRGDCINDETSEIYLQFYMDENGERIYNVAAVIDYLLGTASEDSVINWESIWSWVSSDSDIYVTESQLREIFGADTSSLETDLPDRSDLSWKLLFAIRPGSVPETCQHANDLEGLKYYRLEYSDGEYLYFGIGIPEKQQMDVYCYAEMDDDTMEVVAQLDLSEEETEIEIPESNLTEEQVEVLKKLYDWVA